MVITEIKKNIEKILDDNKAQNITCIDLKNKSYNWPMYVENNPINLNPGDILIYKGCEVEHWRDKFIGLNHAQAFLHYNNIDGPFNNKYDGREFLGIPKKHLG